MRRTFCMLLLLAISACHQPPTPSLGGLPAFCENYSLLLRLEAERDKLLIGSAEARERAEAQRQGALLALREEFGDHPAGVAQGLDVLQRSPIAIDNPDAPAAEPLPVTIQEALDSIQGYVGPLCSP